MNNKKIYIVASLPRSGTTTMCEMLTIIGHKCNHCLGKNNFDDLVVDGTTVFADTPYYHPMFLLGLIQSKKYNLNIIYNRRPLNQVKDSMIALGMPTVYGNYSKPNANKSELMDVICYSDINNNKKWMELHYQNIKRMCELHEVPILDYTFDQGWKPLCDFVGCENVPSSPLPHKNKR